ncbi:hypothetical protein [Telmatospirillum sp.]|uniref:hypothetical protein n=1 Tax=Telmatospirillum sp. TaxID=2079197 RepID=UPI0028448702|nr:hypothetical protein [Telmatospirillum sp.]MDR3436414.1 hypothetical protein [Telmatospirillum sp.]
MYDRNTMIANTISAIRQGSNGQWLAMGRGGAMLHTAHDKVEHNKVKSQLERQLQKTGLYTASYVTKLISQMTTVASFWRWDLPEFDAANEPLSFVDALDYNAIDDTKADLEALATGSIVQQIRALWQSLNEIKKSGPINERVGVVPPAARKGKTTTTDTSKPNAKPTETDVDTLDDAINAVALFQPTAVGLSSALATRPDLVKALREALLDLDTANAERELLKEAA